MAGTNTESSRIVTGKVRLHFVNIFSVDDDGFYSIAILIPKTDKATLTKIKALTDKMKKDPKTVAKIGGKFLDSYKTPLRDGDTERDTDTYPAYAGCYFLNAKTKFKPNTVDAQMEPIIDPSEVYAGCYGRVSLDMYAFNTDGNKGLGCGLYNVQKLADGEPIMGGASAEDDFGPMGDDEADDDFLN